jgi:TPR repeat protein
MKWVDSIDTGAIDLLGTCYYNGLLGFQQDETMAIEVWMRAAELGFIVNRIITWVCITTTGKIGRRPRTP